jgi:hypothetical protein
VHRQGCARLGIARLNAFRLNVFEPITYATVDGSVPWPSEPGKGLFIEGASIEHALNDQVDTAQFTARGWTPVAGQRVAIYSGAVQAGQQLFAGRILETTARYLQRPANVVTDIHLIDPSWLLGRTKVLAYYASQSATTIILDLMARFTRGVASTFVQTGLPVIPAVTFTNEDVPTCLTTICQQIGAYWFIDYDVALHVFTVADLTATPITQAAPRQSADHQISEDLSQVATRIIGLGGGVGAAVDLAAGATELPLDLGTGSSASWYLSTGGLVQVGAQRLSYASIKGASGAGALVGIGNAPTSAPGVAPASGSGLGTGVYKWAVSYKTAAGETVVGPLASMPTGGSAPSLNAVSMRTGIYTITPPSFTTNANYIFRVAVLWQGGGFSFGPPTGAFNVGTKLPQIGLGPIAYDAVTGQPYNSWLLSSAPTAINQIQIYASLANAGAPYYHVLSISGPSSTDWLDVINGQSDATRLANNLQYPTGPVATFNAAALTLPVSGSGAVTGRAIYRTVVNGAALKLVTVVANNTATTYTDTLVDGSLGASPPGSDTSGLSDTGQVAAGATSVPVTTAQPFIDDGGASGGWVTLGNLTVRYGGISGLSLTGIPASGPGSITATVRYGAQALVQPRLAGIPATGTGAITLPILKGDQVTHRIELSDTTAALALANRLGSSNASDGLVDLVLSDSRFAPTELGQNCLALLTERKDPRVVVSYTIREDLTHDVGRLVTINLTTPPIVGTFRIQKVTFSEIAVAGARTVTSPLRRVEATNKLFTFADILRQLRGREGGVPA